MNFLSEYKCEIDGMILLRVWIDEMYKKYLYNFICETENYICIQAY